jgi:hypothetical protein
MSDNLMIDQDLIARMTDARDLIIRDDLLAQRRAGRISGFWRSLYACLRRLQRSQP